MTRARKVRDWSRPIWVAITAASGGRPEITASRLMTRLSRGSSMTDALAV
jgi:hypothetical protein